MSQYTTNVSQHATVHCRENPLFPTVHSDGDDDDHTNANHIWVNAGSHLTFHGHGPTPADQLRTIRRQLTPILEAVNFHLDSLDPDGEP